jgi:uncharacterized membrane protein YfcA
MVHSAAIDPLFTLSGLVVGVMLGLTGVGGGSLMTPLLVLLFGVHPGTAVGTDLLYVAATTGVGTAVHGAGGTVDWRVVRRLASGSVPATALTLVLLSLLGATHSEHPSGMISFVLGLAVLLTAAVLLSRSWLLRILGARLGPDGPRNAATITVLTGVVLGVLVTLSSVGAGALGTLVLFLLYPRMPTARIIGSDIAHAVPLTLLAGAGHWMLGSVDWHLLLSLLSGSIPGIIIGSLIAIRVPDTMIRPALACVLILVGSRLVF